MTELTYERIYLWFALWHAQSKLGLTMSWEEFNKRTLHEVAERNATDFCKDLGLKFE